jgi:hypothetical protein
MASAPKVNYRVPDNTSAIGKLTALAPVVDHVGIGPIEPVRMRTLHGDTLHGHSISVGVQAPAGIFASQVHAGLYSRSARGCKRFASIQQLVETFTTPAPPRAAPNLM